MGAFTAAGWAGSARGETHYGGKRAWLAGRGRCTASSWAVRVDWDLYILRQQSSHNRAKCDCGLCHIMATAGGSNGA